MSQDIIIRRNIGVDNDAQLEITNIDNSSIISQFTVKSVIDNTIFKLVGEHTDINNTVNGLYSISSDGRFVFGSTNVPSNPSTLVEFVAEGYAILFPRLNVTDIGTPTNGHIIYDLLSNKFKFRENDVWNSIPISLIGSTSSNGSETWFGTGAGDSSTNYTQTLFLGYYAGSNVTGNAQKSNFIGYYAGAGANNAYNANFIGVNAGDGATDANKSNFIGHRTGNNATNAYHSNFIGRYVGTNATNAHTSNFFGHYAGNNATNASRSIFIGDYAGYNDSVDNYNNDNTYTSILIGSYTTTGGFSKSIALGYLAANTKENQFVVGDSYVNWKIAGIEYIMPSSLGATGDMLTVSDNATGALSWTDPNTRYLQLSGGTMTGNIQFGTGGQNINRGTFDNSTSGDQGISLICAIGYELNWQGGRLSSWYNGAYTSLQLDSSLQFNTDNSIIKAVENNIYGATSGPFTIHASDGTNGGNGGGILLLRGGNSFTGDNELAGDVQIKGGINAYPSTLYGGYIRLFTNDLERLTIDSANGYVGINTTTPTQHLEVNGNILSNSKIINGTGGNGFLQLLSQNSAPSAVLSNIKIYSNSTNNLSWVRRNAADNADIIRTIVAPDSNFTLTFTGAYNPTFAQTGSYTYTLPSATSTLLQTSSELTVSFGSTTSNLTISSAGSGYPYHTNLYRAGKVGGNALVINVIERVANTWDILGMYSEASYILGYKSGSTYYNFLYMVGGGAPYGYIGYATSNPSSTDSMGSRIFAAINGGISLSSVAGGILSNTALTAIYASTGKASAAGDLYIAARNNGNGTTSGSEIHLITQGIKRVSVFYNGQTEFLGATQYPYVTKIANYTLTDLDYTVEFTAASTATLPDIVTSTTLPTKNSGRIYVIVNNISAGGNVTISINTAGQIWHQGTAANTFTLTTNKTAIIQAGSGTDYRILSVY